MTWRCQTRGSVSYNVHLCNTEGMLIISGLAAGPTERNEGTEPGFMAPGISEVGREAGTDWDLFADSDLFASDGDDHLYGVFLRSLRAASYIAFRRA